VLAIDPGSKKSGFAFADRLRIAVHPLEPVRTNGDDAALLAHIAALVEERDVSTLLVGVPLDPEGGETRRSGEVRVLVARLRERFPHLDVRTYDEHLTTKEAESRLREAGYSGPEIQARKDSWAAMVLLEDWLESGEPE